MSCAQFRADGGAKKRERRIMHLNAHVDEACRFVAIYLKVDPGKGVAPQLLIAHAGLGFSRLALVGEGGEHFVYLIPSLFGFVGKEALLHQLVNDIVIIAPSRVVGGVITGVMDMSSGNALFADPGAILQDRMISQHFADRYDMDLGIGTGYIDAATPGAQSAAEKSWKILSSYLAGKTNYPVGIVEGGKTFSPAQAIIDLEIANIIHRAFDPPTVDDDTLALDVIREAGIGGSVLASDHTALNFRDVLHLTDILARSPTDAEDMFTKANRKWQAIVAESTPFELDGDKAEQIDKIVAKAEKFFEENAS